MTEEISVEEEAALPEPAPKSRTLPPIKLHKYVDADQAKKDLAYTLSDLSGAMSDQASMLMHYGTLYAKSARQVDHMKLLLSATEGKIYRTLKTQARAAGEKPTDAGLQRDVSVHPAVLQVKQALSAAEEVELIAKIAVEAFKHRKDMLVQEGARDREELKGEVRIMARDVQEEANKAGINRFKEARAAAAAKKADAA